LAKGRFLVLLICLYLVGCQEPKTLHVYQRDIDTAYLQLLHNRERAQRNMPQLQYDDALEKYAQQHAKYMASRRRLKHSSLDYDYRMRGENIAMGQRTEEEVLNSWMRSRGHRANILNGRFTHAGFGCAQVEGGDLYWCACFGGN